MKSPLAFSTYFVVLQWAIGNQQLHHNSCLLFLADFAIFPRAWRSQQIPPIAGEKPPMLPILFNSNM
jgi:hypothetical protein